MKLKSGALVLLAACALTACNDDDDYNYSEKKFEYSFDEGLNGWQVGFADYPEGEAASFSLDSGIVTLPAPLDSNINGLMLTGDNVNEDLFMYAQRKVDGLLPSTTYSVTFNIELGSTATDDSVGAGTSVYLKAGAVNVEPKTAVDSGLVALNLDKGNGSEGGDDLIVLGNISNGTDSTSYAIIERSNGSAPISITTNENGEAWLIFGTDSGFEGVTELYFTELDVIFREIPGQQ